jgi:hypothetical protein
MPAVTAAPDAAPFPSSPKEVPMPNQSAIELLKADHREVEQLFKQYETARRRQQRSQLVEKIAVALTVHTILEEQIFYPACSEHGVEEDELEEAQVEHDAVKLLVRELLEGDLDEDYYDAKVTVLSEYVKHHVHEEEMPLDGIFARAEKTDLDFDALGRELQELKEQLMQDQGRLLSRPPRFRSLHLSGRSRSGGGGGRGRSVQEVRGGWYDHPSERSESARQHWRHRPH